MDIDPKASLRKHVVAVINTGGGGCDANSAGRMAEILMEADLAHAEVISVTAEDIDKALEDAVAAADVLVVLGGDGTIRNAAEKCGKAGKLLIPLPGGTMNMLPRALYGDVRWDMVLKNALISPKVRDVSGGMADGQPFFCVAILGPPSLWADAREALRRGRPIQALKRSYVAFRRGGLALDYQFGDNLFGRAEGVAVICPLVSKALAQGEHSLEAAALEPMTAGAMFRLAFHAIFDDWRRHPSVVMAKVKTVRVSGRGRVPVILDGEKVYLGATVNVVFHPLMFRAIVPAELI